MPAYRLTWRSVSLLAKGLTKLRTSRCFFATLLLVVSGQAGSAQGGPADDAKKVATAFERAAEGSAVCDAKRNSQTILCIVNTSDAEADKMALGVVLLANSLDVNLGGWKVTLVTPNDYVVSRDF